MLCIKSLIISTGWNLVPDKRPTQSNMAHIISFLNYFGTPLIVWCASTKIQKLNIIYVTVETLNVEYVEGIVKKMKFKINLVVCAKFQHWRARGMGEKKVLHIAKKKYEPNISVFSIETTISSYVFELILYSVLSWAGGMNHFR